MNESEMKKKAVLKVIATLAIMLAATGYMFLICFLAGTYSFWFGLFIAIPLLTFIIVMSYSMELDELKREQGESK